MKFKKNAPLKTKMKKRACNEERTFNEQKKTSLKWKILSFF